MVYLDNAATTKVSKEVIDVMLPFFEQDYFNASSSYHSVKLIQNKIEYARECCASLINAQSQEIIFTSGATEAINFALKGFIEENYQEGSHIISVKTEHKAVLHTLEYLQDKGVEVTYLNVNENGQIDLQELRDSIRKTTVLICVMLVNNETGVIHNIEQITTLSKEHNIKVFCDATQGVGKIKVNVEQLDIDMLCASAHKFYGPKGIGFLYKKQGLNLTPLLHGGSQEKGLRGGTYNTPLIVGLGRASELASERLDSNLELVAQLNTYLREKLSECKKVKILSKSEISSVYIVNILIEDFDANIFIAKNKDLAVSNGSACTARLIEPSHVLRAMGLNDKQCNGCLRISFSAESTKEDIDFLLNLIGL